MASQEEQKQTESKKSETGLGAEPDTDEFPGGGWHIYRQGSAEYFEGGFEFRKSVFWGVMLTAAVFFIC